MHSPRKSLVLLVAAMAVLMSCDSNLPKYITPAAILAPAEDTIAVGTTGMVQYYVVSAGDDTLDNITVRSVSADTTTVVASGDSLTGLKLGSTVVSFFAFDTLGHQVPGVEADVLVQVVPETIASLSLSLTTDTLAVAATATLTATPLAADGSTAAGHTITWLSGNKQVATVSTHGTVLAVSPGIARITAVTDGGFSATATIVVVPASSASTDRRRKSDLE